MMLNFPRLSIPLPERLFGTFRLVVAILALALLSGCAAILHRPDPMTTEDVVRLVKAQTPPAEIIQKLRETRTVLPLSGSQFAKLREQGVPDEVLDYLQSAYLGAVEFDARMRYQNMYWGGWGPPHPNRAFHGPLPYWYYW